MPDVIETLSNINTAWASLGGAFTICFLAGMDNIRQRQALNTPQDRKVTLERRWLVRTSLTIEPVSPPEERKKKKKKKKSRDRNKSQPRPDLRAVP